MSVVFKTGGWLVPRNGQGSRDAPLERPVTCIGRASDNDVVVTGDQAATVSSYHAEIRRAGDRYLLCDRGSTNGTYLNGRLVAAADLEPDCIIRLGPNGPEFLFEVREAPVADLDSTVVLPDPPTKVTAEPRQSFNGGVNGTASNGGDHHDALVAEAVQEVRSARRRGEADQTAIILRKLLHTGIKQSSRRLKQVIAALVVLLAGVAAYSAWAIADLQRQKSDIDAQIAEIESRLEDGGQDPVEIDQLIARLTLYQQRARSLQDNLFYQFTDDGRTRIFVRREIETLLAEFGANEYNIPAEFVDKVQEFIELYQGPDRPNMERAMGRARGQLDRMRKLVEENNLPGDLAYMALVESAFVNGRTSHADAAGLWQFRAETAQQFGLVVNDQVDERFDVEKSTHAAARYIRSLILEFGSGNSVGRLQHRSHTSAARGAQSARPHQAAQFLAPLSRRRPAPRDPRVRP
jgi:pSer/pThr/pTyr-binding forkhead associated (FHA) protein